MLLVRVALAVDDAHLLDKRALAALTRAQQQQFELAPLLLLLLPDQSRYCPVQQGSASGLLVLLTRK